MPDLQIHPCTDRGCRGCQARPAWKIRGLRDDRITNPWHNAGVADLHLCLNIREIMLHSIILLQHVVLKIDRFYIRGLSVVTSFHSRISVKKMLLDISASMFFVAEGMKIIMGTIVPM
jgi:hypothetical protein